MSPILDFFTWFAQNAAIRILAGVLFFALLGFALARLTGKISVSLFIVLGLGFGALFLVSPAAHLLLFLVLLLTTVFFEARKRALRRVYTPAVALVESGGIKRGLTPPEAAVLLEKPVGTVAAVTLLGLLHKGALVIQPQPPLSFEVAPPLRVRGGSQEAWADQRRQAAQALGIALHPYEEPFLTQIEMQAGEPVRSLSLVAPVRALLRYTARRVGGHNLAETRTYYRKHLGRARHDVAHFGEGPGGQKVRDHHVEWLLLDEAFAALYADTRPAWLGDAGPVEETLGGWAPRLLEEATAAVAPGALQVRDAAGRRFALGGEDPVTADIFMAVGENIG